MTLDINVGLRYQKTNVTSPVFPQPLPEPDGASGRPDGVLLQSRRFRHIGA